MDTTEGFEDFVTIVQEGSVAAAARVLDVPRATLSRRLSRLEASLGVRLLHRTTRRLDLTQAGEALFARAERIVVEARVAREEVARLDGVPRGLLRVSIPPGGGASSLACMLAGYVRDQPEVRLEVSSSSRHVDLAAEGFDVGLRAGPPRDDGLIGRLVLRHHVQCFASPAYLERRGNPAHVDALIDHECILGFAGADRAEHHWPLLDGGTVRVRGRVALDDMSLRLGFAREGWGLTLAPRDLITTDLDAGLLTAVLPDEIGNESVVRIVYPERRFLDPKVRTFIDHAVDWFSREGAFMGLAAPPRTLAR